MVYNSISERRPKPSKLMNAKHIEIFFVKNQMGMKRTGMQTIVKDREWSSGE